MWRPVSLGCTIVGKTGRVIDSQAADGRLLPSCGRAVCCLERQHRPGDYILKLAVADGNASAQSNIASCRARAPRRARQRAMVSGPPNSFNPMRPTVGYSGFGVSGTIWKHADRRGSRAEEGEVRDRIPDSDADQADAEGVPGGRDRTIFSQVCSFASCRRRSVLAWCKSLGLVKTLARPFSGAPAVLMTSAAVPRDVAPPKWYLPVADAFFARKFNRDRREARHVARIPPRTVAPDEAKAFDRAPISVVGVSKPRRFSERFVRRRCHRADVVSGGGLPRQGDGPAAAAWQTASSTARASREIYGGSATR